MDNARLHNKDGLKRQHTGYVKRCGQPKKGHTCTALLNNEGNQQLPMPNLLKPTSTNTAK